MVKKLVIVDCVIISFHERKIQALLKMDHSRPLFFSFRLFLQTVDSILCSIKFADVWI